MKLRTAGAALALALAVLVLGACPAPEGSEEPAAEALTRQQKDSVIAESRLPGAGGVRRAIDAADAAAERASAHDSIR